MLSLLIDLPARALELAQRIFGLQWSAPPTPALRLAHNGHGFCPPLARRY